MKESESQVARTLRITSSDVQREKTTAIRCAWSCRGFTAGEAPIESAEQIVEQEAQRFTKEWTRRRNGPVIEQLTRWCETRRQDAVQHLLSRLRGKLSDTDWAATEKAFSLFQNQFLHGPIRALTEETHAGAAGGYTLSEALLKLFRLPD
jgi:glutamyl-tRNA reductase